MCLILGVYFLDGFIPEPLLDRTTEFHMLLALLGAYATFLPMVSGLDTWRSYVLFVCGIGLVGLVVAPWSFSWRTPLVGVCLIGILICLVLPVRRSKG
ncbi:MAG: hypothetical protein CSA97_05700 [Bacteroidetes bacterium]|nr:MAG: hypothetical protein CSA97_05700 [Bacteroidota bacterium]